MAQAPLQLKKVTVGSVDAVPTNYVGFIAGSDGKLYAKDGSSAAVEIGGGLEETAIQDLIDTSLESPTIGTLNQDPASGTNPLFWTIDSPSAVSGDWQFGANNFVASNSNGTDNFVWSGGMNVTPGGIRKDTNLPAIREAWESNYFFNGVYNTERHIESISNAGTPVRVWSMMAAHDHSYIEAGQTASLHHFTMLTGATIMQFKTSTNRWECFKTFRREYNGPGDDQLNATSSAYINLPYIDSSNRTRISSSMLVQGSGVDVLFDSPSTNVSRIFSNTAIVIQCNFANFQVANASGTYFQGTTTGTILYNPQAAAPATASSTGTAGEIRFDSNYMYRCVATNTWKRVAIATW